MCLEYICTFISKSFIRKQKIFSFQHFTVGCLDSFIFTVAKVTVWNDNAFHNVLHCITAFSVEESAFMVSSD